MSDNKFAQGFITGNDGLGGSVDDNTHRSTGGAPPVVGGQGTQHFDEHSDVVSVDGRDVRSGGSNVNGGVARRKRRVIKGLAPSATGLPVRKNYLTSTAVMFNNFEELVQDAISREYAQEIKEELFGIWGVPLEQPEAAKYAEDLLHLFLVAVTASNKADYNVSYEIPVKGGTGIVVADFSQLSRLLEYTHLVTRRQFARGLADELRGYLKQPENNQLMPALATRVGCEPLLAYLAFDGSTHCTGMTTREVAFTKTLESRNLFERDDVVAQGASDRLMQGMSGGVRAVAPR